MPDPTCQGCGAAKKIAARGLCAACYMRERRAHRGWGRRPNGDTLRQLLGCKDQSWRQRILDFISPAPDGRGCRNWQGPKTKGGYGVVSIAGHMILGHRAVFAFAGGDPEVEVVMHTCDNPACCNPDHLVAGTYRENMEDMARKGRRDNARLGRHLKDRESHPRSRRIVTPQGEFPSAMLAAEAIGRNYRTVLRLANAGQKGFRWAEEV